MYFKQNICLHFRKQNMYILIVNSLYERMLSLKCNVLPTYIEDIVLFVLKILLLR